MGKILVVDDDSDIRELLSLSLTIAGHTVDEAADGPSALRMVEEGTFDLIVLDVSMPSMSGLEVAQRIRASPAPVRPLILMLSAMATPQDAAAGLAAGADEYTTKPFHVSHLSAHVHRMLAESQRIE